jgi:hypothetical protein
MASPYGKKGGTSVNAGRRSATYEVTTPDGAVHRKRSFQVDADEAWIGCYFSDKDQKWYAAGVACDVHEQDGKLIPLYAERQEGKSIEWARPGYGQTAIKARRTK